MKTKIIVISGGSFQGKSTISFCLASRFKISCVISTDLIRNILKLSHPEKSFFSKSIYKLNEKLIEDKRTFVSDTLKNIINLYYNRREHIIIEGIHFSKEFINWCVSSNFCCIFLDNTLSLEDRIILKSKTTRSHLRLINDKDFSFIDEHNVKSTKYIEYENQMTYIHKSMKKYFESNNCPIVAFSNIEVGKMKAIKIINEFYNEDSE